MYVPPDEVHGNLSPSSPEFVVIAPDATLDGLPEHGSGIPRRRVERRRDERNRRVATRPVQAGPLVDAIAVGGRVVGVATRPALTRPRLARLAFHDRHDRTDIRALA